jgi:hypothetical protein
MLDSSWQPFVKTNQTWTLYNTTGCQDESNMNSLQNKWQSRRIKHEHSTKQMVVQKNQTWTPCLIRLDSHLFCREFMFYSSWQPVVLLRVHVLLVLTAISFLESSCSNQTWTLYKTNGCQDESNMNSLQNKWQSRRIKHELSTKQMAVKTNQTWTLYTRVHVWIVLTAICCVESSCLIPLDCHLFCREFMRIKYELFTTQLAVKTNQTWTLYNTNGSQDEENMKTLQSKWLFRRIKHELSTKENVWFVLTAICFVESSCLIRLDSHLCCREFMFYSSWLSFLL